MIENTPGFYSPLPPLNPTDVVSAKNTPDMGVGLFATCGFQFSQVIFSERPLLVFPRSLSFITDGNDFSDEAVTIQCDAAFERTLLDSLTGMPKEDVDTLVGLSNSLPHKPPLYGTALTNAIDTENEEENVKEGKVAYRVVGRLASRINHRYVVLVHSFIMISNNGIRCASCIPNVHIKFDIPTFSLQIIALRDIEADQQLFYSYTEVEQSVKDRQAQLAAYGFECQCKACIEATPENDELREEMNSRAMDMFKEVIMSSQFSVRSLDPLLELEKEIVKAELDFGESFTVLLYGIAQAYMRVDSIPKHKEYLRRGNKLAKIYTVS
jgi:hypothetical protein